MTIHMVDLTAELKDVVTGCATFMERNLDGTIFINMEAYAQTASVSHVKQRLTETRQLLDQYEDIATRFMGFVKISRASLTQQMAITTFFYFWNPLPLAQLEFV